MNIKAFFNKFSLELKKDRVLLFFVGVLIVIVILIVITLLGGTNLDSDQLESDGESQSEERSELTETPVDFDRLLPYTTGTFSIDKDFINEEYDLLITVSDEDRAISDFNEWMEEVGQNPDDLNLSIVTLEDQVDLQTIIDLLPVENSSYSISYSLRTEQIVANILDSDYSRGKSAVEDWFRSQGVDDVEIFNIVWIDRSSL